jgi:Mn-dependent DtxR family transcriptional regulator
MTANGSDGSNRSVVGASQYLLVLYIAEKRENTPTSSGYVARKLDRSPSSATEMLQRLAEDDLVVHEPYEGGTLTQSGREAVADLYGTYQVLSRFFREVLDLDEYEAEAIKLSGNVSSTVVERLAATILTDEERATLDDPR